MRNDVTELVGGVEYHLLLVYIAAVRAANFSVV